MTFRLALAAALFAAVALAQETPADPQAAARAAFAEVQTAMAAMAEARGAGPDYAKLKAAAEAHQAALEKFRVAFATSDWDRWDPGADRDLLLRGLSMSGIKALEAGDGQTAVRAFEMIAAKLPDSAGQFAAVQASAYAAAGSFEKALALVEKSLGNAGEKRKPGVLVLLGDYKAAKADVAGAQKEWQAALDLIPAGIDPRIDPRSRAKADAEMRLALVGKEAPQINASTWIDGERKPLSALKGSVVLVDFWATWVASCRRVMPSLDALYKEKKPAGLIVLGVTRFYANGFVPKPGMKDPLRDGEMVAGLTEDTFLEHVKLFKTNLGISYPFAIATEAEFKAYSIQDIPTRFGGMPALVVVGRDGKVAFVSVGGGDEALLKVVIDRQLATKS